MSKGKVNYKMGQNLEPIANAVTSMNQSSTKKDKPTEMAQKIKAISTDATATEGNVLNGQTFYSGGSKKTGSMPNKGAWTGRIGVNGKITIPAGYHNGSGYVDQSITSRGSITPAVSATRTNPMYVRVPQGYYGTNASSGYPETSVTLSQMRSAGLCLQSELTSMTQDRDSWKNVANSRVNCTKGSFKGSTHVNLSLPIGLNNFIVMETSSYIIYISYSVYDLATKGIRLFITGARSYGRYSDVYDLNYKSIPLDTDYTYKNETSEIIVDSYLYGNIHVVPNSRVDFELWTFSDSYFYNYSIYTF